MTPDKPMFQTILIANRGEIACRIMRTCRQLGIRTVAVYSQADADAQHVRQADVAVPIGGPLPADSYLRGEAIIAAALQTGAEAIHPGYGFLSENPDFAEAVEQAGLVFIGPRPDSVRRMGSKAGAKELMAAAGVPVVPGYNGANQDPAHLATQAQRIGYPLMIKAAYGGGGKGMRVVHQADGFAAALESCQREAQGAFGEDRVLLERYVERPRHIEFQVFGDHQGHVIHLNERECSAQRRYQKVLEESPSPALDEAMRQRMGDAAVLAARTLDYVNAGTVEFIVGADGDFYFMEINNRLQVEHPVTEMVTGLDLVELQLRIAAGQPLPPALREGPVPVHGHAIEARLYAEDPEQGFLPGSGRLEQLRLPPASADMRIDSGVVEGDTVSIFYDPMIAKLIVHAADRKGALQAMRTALAQTNISGPKSNIAFLEQLLRHPAVVEASIDTAYLDRHLDEFLPDGDIGSSDAGRQALLAAAVGAVLDDEAAALAGAAASLDPHSPWARRDGWRIQGSAARNVVLMHGEQRITLRVAGWAGDYRVELDDGHHDIAGARRDGTRLSLRCDDLGRHFDLLGHGNQLVIHDGTQRWSLTRAAALDFDTDVAGSGDHIRAPMPGRIITVHASAGDAVGQDDEVLVMEAMKMELALRSPRDGTIKEIHTQAGDFVDADAILVTLE